jgi:hypothetical protein
MKGFGAKVYFEINEGSKECKLLQSMKESECGSE